LSSLQRLEKLPHVIKSTSLLNKIYKVEECLKSQTKEIIEDLNNICGENGLYYDIPIEL
jgi:hypothetical protein